MIVRNHASSKSTYVLLFLARAFKDSAVIVYSGEEGTGMVLEGGCSSYWIKGY